MKIKIKDHPLIFYVAIYLFVNFFVNPEPWREVQKYNKQDSILSSIVINEDMKIKIEDHPLVF